MKVYNELLERSPDFRKQYMEAFVREGMLLVQVWDGQEWVTVDFVWEVGPAVSKLVGIRLGGYLNGNRELRLRLESTAGLWMIDTIALAKEVPSSGTRHIATLRSARGKGDKDHRSALLDIDGDYLIMPPGAPSVMLTYDVPSGPAEGWERSILLRSSGYYTLLALPEITPDPGLFRRLLTEPGLFGAYAHGMLVQRLQNR